jgi:hypothetical protein
MLLVKAHSVRLTEDNLGELIQALRDFDKKQRLGQTDEPKN